MLPKKEYFETLDLNANAIVRLGDNKSCEVECIGTIRTKNFNDLEFLIHNVKYAFNLR